MAFDVLRRLSAAVYFLVLPDDAADRSRVERLIDQMHAFRTRLGASYTGPIKLINCTLQNLQHTCLGIEVEDVFFAGPTPSLSYLMRFCGDLRRDLSPPSICVFYCESPVGLAAHLAAAYLLVSAVVASATDAAGALLTVLPEWAPCLFSPSAMHSLSVLESALASDALVTTPRSLSALSLRPWPTAPAPYLQVWAVREHQREMLWSGRAETAAAPDVLEYACAVRWSGDLCLRFYTDAPAAASGMPSELLPLFSFQVHSASFAGDVWRLEADVLGLDTDRRFSRSFVVEMRLSPVDPRAASTVPVAGMRNGDELTADGPSVLLPDPTGVRVTIDSTSTWADLRDAPLTLYPENGSKRSVPVQSVLAVGAVAQSCLEFSSPQRLSLSPPAPVRCLLTHGRELWIGCADGKLMVVHLEGKQVLAEIDAHKSRVSALCSLGGCVWSASADGTICLWTPVAPHSLKRRSPDLQPAGISAMQIFFGSVWALDSAAGVSCWNADGALTRKFKLPAPGACMTRLAEQIWMAVDSMLYAFDGKSGKLETFFKAHDSSVSSLAACEARLWSASTSDRTLRAWNAKTCECIRIIPGEFETPLVTIDRCLWAISGSHLLLLDADSADLAQVMSISGPKWQAVYEIRKGHVAVAAADRSVTVYSLANAGPTLSLFTVDATLTLHGTARQPLERFACVLRSLLPPPASPSAAPASPLSVASAAAPSPVAAAGTTPADMPSIASIIGKGRSQSVSAPSQPLVLKP